MCRAALFFVLLLSFAPAWAGPKEAVHAAFSKFLAAKSFRASVIKADSGEKISDLAFVAPDRYRVRTGRGPEMIIIGDNAWMNMNGRTIKAPIPIGKIIGRYRDDRMIKQIENGLVITDLGSGSVDGKPAHAYHYVVTDPAKADVKLWIGDKSGLPLQIESQGSFMGHASTTRILYSDYNDPSIHIAPPQG